MKWMKGLKEFGVAGGAIILSSVSTFLAVLIAGVVQVLTGVGFRPELFLAAILIALALVGPLSYVVMVSLFELDDAVYDLNRKEAQVKYLVKTVLEKGFL